MRRAAPAAGAARGGGGRGGGGGRPGQMFGTPAATGGGGGRLVLLLLLALCAGGARSSVEGGGANGNGLTPPPPPALNGEDALPEEVLARLDVLELDYGEQALREVSTHKSLLGVLLGAAVASNLTTTAASDRVLKNIARGWGPSVQQHIGTWSQALLKHRQRNAARKKSDRAQANERAKVSAQHTHTRAHAHAHTRGGGAHRGCCGRLRYAGLWPPS
jgi:hypothetical protein